MTMVRARNAKKFEYLFLQPPHDDGQYAALWFGEGGNRGMYIAGYSDAAAVLLKSVRKHSANNSIVYPLMMLLRHTIELSLKDLTQRAIDRGARVKINEKQPLWRTHRFDYLVPYFEEGIKCLIGLPSTWAPIRSFLIDWESADPDGIFARYCREPGGKPVHIPKGRNISIRNLCEAGELAIDYLYGCGCELNQWDEVQQEMREAI